MGRHSVFMITPHGLDAKRSFPPARTFLFALGCLTLLLLPACGGKKKPPRLPTAVPPTRAPVEGSKAHELEGIASFYGEPHHGRPTANGEIFNKQAMTAAHRTLPFNTRVVVHNLENGRTVEVRINDRGPFIAGRIIDLSERAGRELGIYGPGTARVRLEIVSSPADTGGGYGVQVGAFAHRANAENLRQQLTRRYAHVALSRYDSGRGIFYRVRVGTEPTLTRANELAQQLQRENLETFVVRVDEP